MLNTLSSPKTKKRSVRKGRGIGSKSGGHTIGRGQKGQKSRSGYSRPRAFFEGGSNPLIKRVPKLKGFSRASFEHTIKKVVVNLRDLNNLTDGQEVTIDNLKEIGLIKIGSGKIEAKVLANGTIDKKVKIIGIPVSLKAKEAIIAAGGTVE